MKSQIEAATGYVESKEKRCRRESILSGIGATLSMLALVVVATFGSSQVIESGGFAFTCYCLFVTSIVLAGTTFSSWCEARMIAGNKDRYIYVELCNYPDQDDQ